MSYNTHIDLFKQSLVHIPNEDHLNDIIDLFANNERVIFCTMGKSAYICHKIVHSARSFGLNWHYLDASHAFHGDAGLIKKNDLLVFVSKSGETKETVDVAKYFDGWKKIAMTSNKLSSLNKNCRHSLIVPILNEGGPYNVAPMISTTLYMLVLHGILKSTIENKNISLKELARNHPAGKIGDILKKDG